MRSLYKYSLIILLLMAPAVSNGAESLKLRYITSATADEKGVILKLPEGVACTDSELIVADTENDRLVRYTYQDKNLKGGSEIKVAQIAFPIRLFMNSKGEIYVLDGKTHKISRLKNDGTFEGYVEPQGVTAPANFSIKSFRLDSSDNIYLLDIFGERVLKLDQGGKMTEQVPFPKGYGFFTDLAITPGGDILLLDSAKSVVYVSKKGAPGFVPFTKDLSGYMNFASYIATSSTGSDIYLLDQNGGAVVVLGPDGTFKGRQLSLGWKPGMLYYPTQMCMNKKGDVFIADRSNSRVQIFENVK